MFDLYSKKHKFYEKNIYCNTHYHIQNKVAYFAVIHA